VMPADDAVPVICQGPIGATVQPQTD
jgi:hypothetical protein